MWKFSGSRDYEKDSPGLGTNRRYISGNSGWADIYSYDLGRKDWQPGLSDPQFTTHFNGTIGDVQYATTSGIYRDLKVALPEDRVVAGQPFRAVELRFVLVQGEQPLHSMIWLTVRNGKLLKYRISAYVSSNVDINVFSREFIAADLQANPVRKGTSSSPCDPCWKSDPRPNPARGAI